MGQDRRLFWNPISKPKTHSCVKSAVIRIDQINEAYERMLKSDVKYRFVIDMASLAGSAGET